MSIVGSRIRICGAKVCYLRRPLERPLELPEERPLDLPEEREPELRTALLLRDLLFLRLVLDLDLLDFFRFELDDLLVECPESELRFRDELLALLRLPRCLAGRLELRDFRTPLLEGDVELRVLERRLRVAVRDPGAE